MVRDESLTIHQPQHLAEEVRKSFMIVPRWALYAAVLAQIALISSCSSIPKFESIKEGIDAPLGPPRLSATRGPLTAKQSKDVLDKLRRQTPDADILGRHLAFTEAIADSPPSVGNTVTLLRDGEATFRAMFAVIGAAKDHINLEYFTFEDVEQDGRHIIDLLLEKQSAGVQINIIYDDVGSSATPHEVFDRLKAAGVNLLKFNPTDPFKSKKKYAPNSRDHRKILVADGATAIIGGVNISQVYGSNIFRSESESASPSAPIPGAPPRDLWRDTDVQLEGPSVADLQRLYLETWSRQHGETLKASKFFPEKKASGNQVVSVIGSSPAHDVPIYYFTLLSAIHNAETRVWLTAAYFVPTGEEIEELKAAAQRGVDVRLVLPSHSDSPISLNVGRSHYASLLKSGVKIYEIRDVILHSKTAVIDGVWSAIGSSNFDKRSVRFNDEVDAVILGRETGAQMETAHQEYVRKSDQIDRATWVNRPIPSKLKQSISRLWSYWL